MKGNEKLGTGFVVVVLLLVLIPSATATSVGSFPSQKVKEVTAGKSALFTLNFYNLGDRAAKIALDVKTNLSVRFPEGRELVLQPQEPVGTPGGKGNWYILPRVNKYVKTRSLNFAAHLPSSPDKDIYPIKAMVRIMSKNSDSQSKIYQSVVQIREYSFKIRVKNESKVSRFSLNNYQSKDNPEKSSNSTPSNHSIETQNSKNTTQLSSSSNKSKTSNKDNITGLLIGGWSSLGVWLFTFITLLILWLRRRY